MPTITKIQLKRGAEANLPTLDHGEPAFTTDTHKLYIGYNNANYQINFNRIIDINTTTVGNIGTGEDVLLSSSIASNTLSANNDSLEFNAAGTIANNINSKRIRIYFGAAIIFDTGPAGIPISTAIDWIIQGRIIRTGSNTQKCLTTMSTNNTTLAAYADYAIANETLSSAVVLKLTGEGVTNDDIVQELITVEWKSAQ